MRYLIGSLFVVALGAMACSETSPRADPCEGITCEDDGNECSEDVCNPADGTCGLPLEDGAPCSVGACLGSVCTELSPVAGTVALEDANGVTSPAAGATVSVVGTSLSTTTNERGEFSIGVFDGDWFLQSEKDELCGLIQLVTVPLAPGEEVELFVWTSAVGEEFERELGIDLDETKGVISVNFSVAPGMARGGETAELSEPYEHSSATNADGDEVLSDALFAEGGPDLTFWNVNPTEALVVTPKWIDGRGECTLEKPELAYPIKAGFVTLRADARCSP